MSLRERLGATPSGYAATPDSAFEDDAASTRVYQDTKAHIHLVLLDRLDLGAMEGLPPDSLKEELRQMVERLLIEENLVLNTVERRNLVRDIQHEMLGLGPLEPLLADPSVSDILVNTYNKIYVERRGRLN